MRQGIVEMTFSHDVRYHLVNAGDVERRISIDDLLRSGDLIERRHDRVESDSSTGHAQNAIGTLGEYGRTGLEDLHEKNVPRVATESQRSFAFRHTRGRHA